MDWLVFVGAIQIRSGIFFWFSDRHHGRFVAWTNQNFRNLARRHFCALAGLAAGYFGFTVNHDGSSFSS